MMFPSTHALLIGVVFLCGLEETLPSPYGYCTGKHCVAIFREPEDFWGAQESCKNRNGDVFQLKPDHVDHLNRLLPRAVSGSYWLEERAGPRGNEESASGPPNCSSISEAMQMNMTPCNNNLDGFLCQFTSKEEDNCGSLREDESLRVRYAASGGFDVMDSETFQPGTIAVTGDVDGRYPDSKHICSFSRWMPAPWSCDVFNGGCEHRCSGRTHSCACPAGQILHPNNISCVSEECEAESACTGEHERCVITPRGSECRCKHDFEKLDGVCVNNTICKKCEHMLCDSVDGVFRCACRKGFRVSPRDPTKCDRDCRERDCTATCLPVPENKTSEEQQCFCPLGYILDLSNSTPICTDINECMNERQCDQRCENTYGDYRCSCREGFTLLKEHKCVAIEEEDEEDGSGTTPLYPTPVGIHPGVPSYVKTGSVLGITVFILSCAVLVFFVAHNMAKRCGRVDLPPLKHPDLNTFYLQQVTTETYKRLPIDK